MSAVPLRLDAPAKLNLVGVTGRRSDGFHLLESPFVLLELADRLLLMPGCSGLRVSEGTDAVPVDATNLACAASRRARRTPDRACLAVEKRIPVSAGLGGGSSDAAAAWRLGRAWRGLEGAAASRTWPAWWPSAPTCRSSPPACLPPA